MRPIDSLNRERRSSWTKLNTLLTEMRIKYGFKETCATRETSQNEVRCDRTRQSGIKCT